MNSNLIAETVFWATLASIVLAIYQSAILPSIRLQIRCEIFQLRDRLRQLVISGKVSESDKAFILLHDQLNFLACNLFRYDLLRVTQSINNMTRDQTTRVEVCVKIMEEADEDIRAIYRESVGAMMRTIVFNSLFFSHSYLWDLRSFFSAKSGSFTSDRHTSGELSRNLAWPLPFQKSLL